WFRETWNRLDEILETVQSVEPPFTPNIGAAFMMPSPEPSSIPGVSVGVPPKKAVVIKRYKCNHCGASPAVPRVGDICERCQDQNHIGEPRDCQICADNSSTGAL